MERKWFCLSEKQAWEGTERALTAYRFPLSQVTSFENMRRVVAAEGNDWTAVVRNLKRARWKWARLTQVLIRNGADDRTLGNIYLELVQSVLLYGSET